MLPNLSSLSLSRRGDGQEAEIGAPPSDSLPTLVMQEFQSGLRTSFKPNLALALFQSGASFSCVNGSIKFNRLSRFLSRRIFEEISKLSEKTLDASSFSSGTFNRAQKISQANVEAMSNGEEKDLRMRILHESSDIAQQKLDAVVLRTSKASTMLSLLYAEESHNGNYMSLIDEVFQELFISIYAASRGIGLDIYFAKMMLIKFNYNGSDYMIPRVVYIMQAADSSLAAACSVSGYSMSSTMSEKLLALMRKTANSKLLLLDIKPPNMVVLRDKTNPSSMEFNNMKMIDFGTDFATIVPGSSKPIVSEIMYINSSMLCFYVGTVHRRGRKNYECLLPVMQGLYEWLKTQQDYYDENNGRVGSMLIQNLQTKKLADIDFKKGVVTPQAKCRSEAYTLLDANTDVTSIENVVFHMINHYALRKTNMNDPNNYAEPELFEDNIFEPDVPLFPQLVRNFFRFYEDFLQEQNEAQAAQAQPAPPIPNPGPQQAPPSDPKPLFNENNKRALPSPASRREMR